MYTLFGFIFFRFLQKDEDQDQRYDQDAVDELVNTVYASLQTAGPDDPTLETVSTFLRNGGSLETTAKELSVHPNTVRYRLKRAAETTGWDAADAREAYVLRTAIALGRMHTA